MMINSGIYIIVCLITNKMYVGSALCFKYRWSKHLRELRNNIHHSSRLQNAWNKYGEENFIFEIIEKCCREKLIEREQFYIDELYSFYNICKTAGSKLGVKLSKKSIEQRTKSRGGVLLAKRIKVDKYSLSGEFLETYDSITIAGEENKIIYTAAISEACKHKRISVAGYRWTYHNQPLFRERLPFRSVRKLDPVTKTILETYSSIKEAANKNNIKYQSVISDNLSGKNKTAGGFIWEYNN